MWKRVAAKFSKHILISGTEPSAIFDHIPDEAMQESGNVTIPLDSRSAVGSVVRVQLYFADVWMLISEVNFRSFPASEAALNAAATTSAAEADSTTTTATVVGGHFGYDDYPDEIPTGFENEVQESGDGIDQGEQLLLFHTRILLYTIQAVK